MATYKDRVVKSVTHYQPGPLPANPENLGLYVTNELKRIGDILYNQAIFRLERMHEEPGRPRGGDVRYADGTDWNPGGGEGIYFFNETTQAWVKL